MRKYRQTAVRCPSIQLAEAGESAGGVGVCVGGTDTESPKAADAIQKIERGVSSDDRVRSGSAARAAQEWVVHVAKIRHAWFGCEKRIGGAVLIQVSHAVGRSFTAVADSQSA
jgi:hypothetical protein